MRCDDSLLRQRCDGSGARARACKTTTTTMMVGENQCRRHSPRASGLHGTNGIGQQFKGSAENCAGYTTAPQLLLLDGAAYYSTTD